MDIVLLLKALVNYVLYVYNPLLFSSGFMKIFSIYVFVILVLIILMIGDLIDEV